MQENVHGRKNPDGTWGWMGNVFKTRDAMLMEMDKKAKEWKRGYKNPDGTWTWMGQVYQTQDDMLYAQSDMFTFMEDDDIREERAENDYDRLVKGEEDEILVGGGPTNNVWVPHLYGDMKFPQPWEDLTPIPGRMPWNLVRPGDFVNSMEISPNPRFMEVEDNMLVVKASRTVTGSHHLWVLNPKRMDSTPVVISAASITKVRKENDSDFLEVDTGFRDNSKPGMMFTYIVMSGQLMRDMEDKTNWIVIKTMNHGLLLKRVTAKSGAQQQEGYERVNNFLFVPAELVAAKFMILTDEFIQLTKK